MHAKMHIGQSQPSTHFNRKVNIIDDNEKFKKDTSLVQIPFNKKKIPEKNTLATIHFFKINNVRFLK